MRNNSCDINIDIDKLFPAEWYENVTNAANYVLSKINLPEEKIDDIVLHIINYNIDKQLNNKIRESIFENLPYYLSFVDTPATKIFNEFKNILDACDICPSLKEHVMYFQSDDIESDKKKLNFWRTLAKKEYKNLSLYLREMKAQGCIKLIIRKK